MRTMLSVLLSQKHAVLYFFLVVGVLSIVFYVRMFSLDTKYRVIYPGRKTLTTKEPAEKQIDIAIFRKVAATKKPLDKISRNSKPRKISTSIWPRETGPRLENRKDGRCLKNYFKDVILIIVYHYALYDTIPSLTQHYKDAFPHIVFCGPVKSDKFDILAFDMGPGGYYCYECLGKAMQLHPGYRGYLFVNDDMVVNWWNFAKFDKDKLWQGAPIVHDHGHEAWRRPIPKNWIWWTTTNGLEKCEKTHKELTRMAKNSSLNVDVRTMLVNHLRFARNKTFCYRMWSDFAYIPGRLSREFQCLCSLFFKNKVFLEIAVPTIMTFLEDSKSWEKVFGTYLPNLVGFQDFSRVQYVWPHFAEDVLFLHPVKFFGDNGLANKHALETRVRKYVNKYTSC